MTRLGRKVLTPRAAECFTTFQRALRLHIQMTSVLQPKPPPSTRAIGAVALIFAAAIGLMCVLAFS